MKRKFTVTLNVDEKVSPRLMADLIFEALVCYNAPNKPSTYDHYMRFAIIDGIRVSHQKPRSIKCKK